MSLRRRRMKRAGLVALLTVLALLLTGLPGGAGADEEVVTDSGTTAAGQGFGPGVPAGWDYAKISSPNGEAWVAVVWGRGNSEATKGAIWVLGMWTRCIGGAQVYDEAGALVSRSKPLTVKTYYMQRFDALYEFNDTNGDGIANVIRANRPISAAEVIAHEPVYKAVNLRTHWEKTGSSTEVVDGKKLWNLTLTATDLRYVVIGNESRVDQTAGDWKLNRVSFTFHLAGWRETANVTVPMFNITVDKSVTPPNVTTSPAGTRSFTANITRVRAKEDHEFEGWDFDPNNSAPGLVLETHLAWGYWIWSRAPAWLSAAWLEREAQAAGRLSFGESSPDDVMVDAGDETLPDADSEANASDTVKKIGAERRIDFSGNWQREGRLTWTSETSVWADSNATDPGTGSVNFQVQGARRFIWDSPLPGVKLVGVYLMGGFSYSGGPYYRVRHDPTSEMDMSEPQIPDRDNAPPTARIAELPKSEYTNEEAVLLNASGSSDPDGDPLRFEWREGTNVLGTDAVLNMTFEVGSHTIALTVSDDGATNATSVSFSVSKANHPPTARIVSPTAGKEYKTSDTVKLDATGSLDPDGDALTYTWTEGAKTLGTGLTIKKKFGEGTHTVKLTVSDGRGGTGEATVTFKVKEAPAPGFELALAALALAGAAALSSRGREWVRRD
ncbi:MAG: PKD domain-containing protein [Thermoplasmatota archaeon]